ncbi:MAG: ABC transporter ATP-binding protein [Candidatus Geothermarchaeales archaeon]
MIEAVDIYKAYGAIKVLEAFNLTVEEGSSLAIYGRSGSGKTTLLKILGSFVEPDRGTVYIDRRDVSKLEEKELAELRSRLVGFSFQESLLLPYLSAVENVLWPAYRKGASKSKLEERAVDLLSKSGLGERLDHEPGRLSVGENKRVDLVRALLREPTVVIADEPTSNLDSETASNVLKMLREYTDRGGTLVYSTTSSKAAEFSEERISIRQHY